MEFWATPAPTIVVCLCICMVRCALAQNLEQKVGLWVDRSIGFWIVMAAINAGILVWLYRLHDLTLLLIISIFVSIFYPYLGRTSKHRNVYEGEMFRDYNDRLIGTSTIYLLASGVAYFYNQHNLSLMCAVTFVGSASYHRHREMGFFNLDNIFATSLLVVFVYVVCSSYYHHDIVFTLGAVGMPVAVFLLAYCGMPADIALRPSGPSGLFCCTRTGREVYDSVHNLWHLVSGGGPMIAAWYFDHLTRHDLAGKVQLMLPWASEVVVVSELTLLPYAALAIALTVNILGNYFGVMPME